MQGANTRTGLVFFLYTFLLISCGEAGSKGEHPIAVTAPNLKEVTTKLPQASGYETYISNCTICHSASYVQNQPELPQKTWAAIVTKMQKTYGAPVSDSAAQVIIQYLTGIKGKS
jgi:cytochrome c5